MKGGGDLARVQPGAVLEAKGELIVGFKPGIRVLFLSGYSPEAIDVAGEAFFLQKPFTHEALIRKTREALETDSFSASR